MSYFGIFSLSIFSKFKQCGEIVNVVWNHHLEQKLCLNVETLINLVCNLIEKFIVQKLQPSIIHKYIFFYDFEHLAEPLFYGHSINICSEIVRLIYEMKWKIFVVAKGHQHLALMKFIEI